EIPSRPIPPLVVEPSPAPSDAGKARDVPKAVASAEPAPPSPPPLSPPTEPGTLPGLAPVPEAEGTPPPEPVAPLVTSRDRERAARDLAAPPAGPTVREAKGPGAPRARRDDAVRPALLSDELTAAPAAAASTPAQTPAPAAAADPAPGA